MPDFDIRVRVDQSHSQRATRQQISDLERLHREWAKNADAQEKAAKKAADAAVREAKRLADAASREYQRQADVQIREQLKAEKAVDASITREVRADQRKIEQEIRAAERATARKEALSKKAAADHVRETGRMTDSVGGLIGAIGGITSAYALVGAGVKIFKDVAGAAEEAGKHASELADEFIRQRDALREIAFLSGEKADTAFTLKQADFAAKTAMTGGEANAFQTEYLNAGAQFIGKTITKEASDQLRVQAASLGTALQIDPRVVGGLSGILTGTKDRTKMGGKAAGDVTNTLNRSLSILTRGEGDASQLADDLSKMMAASVNEDEMKGVFQKPEDAAILLSAIAEGRPKEAEVFSRAAIRAFQTTKGEGGELMKRAKIGPKTPILEAPDLLAPVVEKEAKQRGLSVQQVIKEYFPEERESQALSILINKGAGPGGAIAERRKFIKEGIEAPEEIVEKFQSDVEGAGPQRIAEAETRRAKLVRGAKKAKSVTLREQALQELIDERAIDTTATKQSEKIFNAQPDVLLGATPEGREVRIRSRMNEIIRRRAKAQGIAIDGGTFQGTGTGLGGFADLRNQANLDMVRGVTAERHEADVNKAAAEFASRGGNILKDIDKKLGEQNDMMKRDAGRPIPPKPQAGAAR